MSSLLPVYGTSSGWFRTRDLDRFRHIVWGWWYIFVQIINKRYCEEPVHTKAHWPTLNFSVSRRPKLGKLVPKMTSSHEGHWRWRPDSSNQISAFNATTALYSNKNNSSTPRDNTDIFYQIFCLEKHNSFVWYLHFGEIPTVSMCNHNVESSK
jgi:hypothetical protein